MKPIMTLGFQGVFVLLMTGVVLAEVGSISRVANTSLKLPLEPPRFDFVTENAFPGLTFSQPLALAVPPGETNRLFVLEKPGIISVVTNLTAPTRSVFLNISRRILSSGEEGLLGLAFHPGYATNGYFFIFYTTTSQTSAGSGRHDRVSRFQVFEDNPNLANPSSEMVLIDQFDQASNHNGGDMHFGPDGYLYIALGDEGGGNDQYDNSQRIDKDFFAGMLRIDVDKKEGNLPPNDHPAATQNYAVPADNPFVGATAFNGRPVNPSNVRSEFFAVGLRNPWRFSFDELTGRIFCGDVGQNALEEINWITKGGNYGWSYREGTMNGPDAGSAPRNFESIGPIHQYGRTQGRSVTGGIVYRGERFTELYGAYIFADYETGRIWSLRPQDDQMVDSELLTTDANIAGFGVDPRNGDVLLADLGQNQIKRLTRASGSQGDPIPALLSEVGAFQNLLSLEVHPGILPYEIRVPFWSDYAKKSRWFSVPNEADQIEFHTNDPWQFPEGTVWIKHFDLEMTNGIPSSARRLETRFLVRNQDGVYGVTYRWNESGDDAVLVEEEGGEEAFTIYSPEGEVLREQVWTYPSRVGCLACHTPQAGWALGFGTAQLNREMDYGNGIEVGNQIKALERAGYFSNSVGPESSLPRLSHLSDEDLSLEHRVRSYLEANCSQCHVPGGLGRGTFDARIEIPTRLTGLIGGELVSHQLHPDNRVIVPGNLERSMIYTRITSNNALRMPPLGSNELDPQARQLLEQWITELPGTYQTYEDWSEETFEGGAFPDLPEEDADGDLMDNWGEFLTKTNPLDPVDHWGLEVEAVEGGLELRFQHLAHRAFEVEWTAEPSNETSWRSLDRSENQRTFYSETRPWKLVLPLGEEPQAIYYRVRAFEP